VQPTNKRDPSVEEVQGKNLIDAAVFNNVQLFVYTSVDRGGAPSATNPTHVPIWITKHRIEQHLRIKAKSSGMRYTILRPTSFMELLSDDLSGRMFASMWKSHFDHQRMHLVAVRDIGFFAAQAFLYSDRYMGVEMTLTGDELTFAEADAVFQDRFGRSLPTANGLLVSVFLRVSKSARTIFEFIKERPADLGIEQCRKIHPGLTDWKTWVGEESAFARNARAM
jgi:nucleoside-diphosphate-sugar epimerase